MRYFTTTILVPYEAAAAQGVERLMSMPEGMRVVGVVMVVPDEVAASDRMRRLEVLVEMR